MATDNTGTANSPYDAVTIETISGEIQAAPLNTSLGNLDTAVQSHSHPLDSNVGWDSMKSSFRPPDTGDSSDRWRMVCGTVSISGTSGAGSATVTFATDSDQGDPSFTTAPRVVALPVGACSFRVSVYASPGNDSPGYPANNRAGRGHPQLRCSSRVDSLWKGSVVPELTDITFASTDTTAEIAEKLGRLTAQMRESVRFGEARVGDTTRLDNDGGVTVGAFTMAEGAAADKVFTSDADGAASWEDAAASVTGSDQEVQFNDGGALGSDPNLKYNKGGKELKTRVFMAVDSTGVKLYNTSSKGVRIDDTIGNVGINCDPGGTTHLDINGDTIRLRTLTTPASSSATGKAGMIMVDGNYIYVCTATNNWKRATLNAF